MERSAIGFTDWSDFVAELRADPPRDVVRVQAFHQNVPTSIGQDWIEHLVVAAAVTQSGNLVVARFKVGGGWRFDLRHDPEKAEMLKKNASIAAATVVDALWDAGFETRPGIIDGSMDVKVTTTPTGLWQWEGERIMPKWIREQEAAGARSGLAR